MQYLAKPILFIVITFVSLIILSIPIDEVTTAIEDGAEITNVESEVTPFMIMIRTTLRVVIFFAFISGIIWAFLAAYNRRDPRMPEPTFTSTSNIGRLRPR